MVKLVREKKFLVVNIWPEDIVYRRLIEREGARRAAWLMMDMQRNRKRSVRVSIPWGDDQMESEPEVVFLQEKPASVMVHVRNVKSGSQVLVGEDQEMGGVVGSERAGERPDERGMRRTIDQAEACCSRREASTKTERKVASVQDALAEVADASLALVKAVHFAQAATLQEDPLQLGVERTGGGPFGECLRFRDRVPQAARKMYFSPEERRRFTLRMEEWKRGDCRYKCIECGMACISSAEFGCHLQMHHKLEVEGLTSPLYALGLVSGSWIECGGCKGRVLFDLDYVKDHLEKKHPGLSLWMYFCRYYY